MVANSAAGPIRAYFVTGFPLSDSVLETNHGTIAIWLPVSLAVQIDAIVEFTARANRIESEFESVTVRSSDAEYGPGRVVAIGEINGGGPVIRLRNTGGRIQIHKRP